MEERTIENGWSMLLKFGAKENLKKLQAGQFYMKNLQYYVDLEKATSDESIGDMYDGQVMLQDVNLSMYTIDTNELVGKIKAPTVSMNLGYLKCPVFCMFIFDYRNHTSEERQGDILKVQYKFTQEQLEKMPDFGEYALITKNGDEFVERVKKGMLNQGIGFSRDFVQYYSSNNLEHLKQVQEDNSRIAFWKRQKYAYQQEYRWLAHTEVDDFLSIDIGDISDITELIKTTDLLNLYIQIDFKIKEKE